MKGKVGGDLMRIEWSVTGGCLSALMRGREPQTKRQSFITAAVEYLQLGVRERHQTVYG